MDFFKALTFGMIVFAGGLELSSCDTQGGVRSMENVELSFSDLTLKESARTGGQFAFLPLGMYMSVLDYSDGVLTVDISNQSGYTMSYGGEYYLQRKVGENWVDIPLPEGFVFTEGAKRIEDLEDRIEKYDLKVFGNLCTGDYRLKKRDLEAPFTLVAKR